MLTLRSHQITDRDLARAAFARGRRGVCVGAPTGYGKTVLAADIICSAEEKGTQTLFLAHREELITQASEKISEAGLPHGIIMAGHAPTPSRRTQVASIQTIIRRMHTLPFRPNFIVIDECHLSAAKSYKEVVEFYGSPPVLGLTATPLRLDSRSLGVQAGGMFDELIVTIGTADLIEKGFLSPFRYYAPSRPELDDLNTVAGDYDQHQLSDLMDKPTLVGDAIDTWLKRASGRSTIVFAVSVKHAEHIAARFRDIGVTARAVSGQTPKAERRQAMEDFKSGAVTVLVNCALYIEGIDCPRISCVMLMAPTQSLTRDLQEIGRGLRTCPGKNECIILDHAGMVYQHGLPDSLRQWSLESAPKRAAAARAAAATIRQCPSCYMVHVPLPACPGCGHVYQIKARTIEEVAGDLDEIDPKRLLDQRQRWEVASANTREALEALAKLRKWKPGAVSMILRGRALKRIRELAEEAKRPQQGMLL